MVAKWIPVLRSLGRRGFIRDPLIPGIRATANDAFDGSGGEFLLIKGARANARLGSRYVAR